MAAQVPDQPWKAAEGRSVGLGDGRDLRRGQRPYRGGPLADPADHRRRLRRRGGRRSRCSTCCRRSAASAATSSPWSAARRASASSAAPSSSPSGSPPSSAGGSCWAPRSRAIHDHRSGTLVVEHARRSVAGRAVVVAVPPPLVDRIEFQPPLPPSHSQLPSASRWGRRSRCNAVYERPFWRPQGLNGYVISDTGPVKIAFDNSPPDGSPGVLVGFFEGSAGSDFYDRSAPGPAHGGARVLRRATSATAALHPTSYLELVWAAEPYTRGAYGSYNPPGVLTSIGHVAGRPVGRRPLRRLRADHAVDRLHGRRDPLRRARRRRDQRRARLTKRSATR